MSRPSRTRSIRWLAGLGVGAAYAWWAAGLHPFTAVSVVAVVLPVIALVGVSSVTDRPAGGRARRPRVGRAGATCRLDRRGVLPWVGLAVAALGLECVALALGGRSSTVPTLSTVVDHAMAWHASRAAVLLVWLAVAWVPTVRRAGRAYRAAAT